MKLSENNQGVGERQLVENLRFPSRFCQKLKSLKMPQCQYAIAIHSNHTPPSHTLHPISKPSHVLDFLMSTSTIFNSTIYASHFVFCFRCTISQNISTCVHSLREKLPPQNGTWPQGHQNCVIGPAWSPAELPIRNEVTKFLKSKDDSSSKYSQILTS